MLEEHRTGLWRGNPGQMRELNVKVPSEVEAQLFLCSFCNCSNFLYKNVALTGVRFFCLFVLVFYRFCALKNGSLQNFAKTRGI